MAVKIVVKICLGFQVRQIYLGFQVRQIYWNLNRFIQDKNYFVPHLWIDIAEKSVKVVQESDSDGRQVHRDVNGPGKVAAFGLMNNVFLVQCKITFICSNFYMYNVDLDLDFFLLWNDTTISKNKILN